MQIAGLTSEDAGAQYLEQRVATISARTLAPASDRELVVLCTLVLELDAEINDPLLRQCEPLAHANLISVLGLVLERIRSITAWAWS